MIKDLYSAQGPSTFNPFDETYGHYRCSYTHLSTLAKKLEFAVLTIVLSFTPVGIFALFTAVKEVQQRSPVVS